MDSESVHGSSGSITLPKVMQNPNQAGLHVITNVSRPELFLQEEVKRERGLKDWIHVEGRCSNACPSLVYN